MPPLMQVPPGAGRAADGGVLVQQGAGLPVRQPGEPGVRAHVARADDLARTGRRWSRTPVPAYGPGMPRVYAVE
jgi:hypothetical protein